MIGQILFKVLYGKLNFELNLHEIYFNSQSERLRVTQMKTSYEQSIISIML